MFVGNERRPPDSIRSSQSSADHFFHGLHLVSVDHLLFCKQIRRKNGFYAKEKTFFQKKGFEH